MKKPNAKIRDGKLIIEVPLDLLQFAIEHTNDTFKVKNKGKMAMFFKNNVLKYIDPYASETGMPDFFRLLDNLAVEAYESAEDWIENPNEPTYRE